MCLELPQEKDFLVTLTRQEFAGALKPIPTTPEIWASPQRPLTTREIPARRRKLGESWWAANLSRPDICARLAQLAAKVNSLRGSDSY